ncbi:hypothetical protein HZH66_005172 [Vespula vulgaris]|uniref:Uncharacterized protein n=1 Tax=Vespula vulgaris TaxID=7454 RepID=A0A834NBJ1_VESVU|nr:hypothetical protein HZH66_005172 [Vespula vulgaris]
MEKGEGEGEKRSLSLGLGLGLGRIVLGEMPMKIRGHPREFSSIFDSRHIHTVMFISSREGAHFRAATAPKWRPDWFERKGRVGGGGGGGGGGSRGRGIEASPSST